MDTKTMQRLHSVMWEIYHEIARICEKHDLQYFAVGGTLIGAAVHKGFIPWDDDLDIAMPRDDYDRFIEVAPSELSTRFFLHHTSTDPDYWLSFAKVRMNNTVFLEEKRKRVQSHAGIYVDIFPFDYADEMQTVAHRVKWRMITYLNNYIYAKTCYGINLSRSGRILNVIFGMFSVKDLSVYRDKVMRSFDKGERCYFVDLAGGRALGNSYFLIRDILPVREMPFEDGLIKAPDNYDRYLVQLYTEKYKIIPPVEERRTHDPIEISFEEET